MGEGESIHVRCLLGPGLVGMHKVGLTKKILMAFKV